MDRKNVLPLLLCILFFSCTQSEDDDKIRVVEYGLSYGECMGYCTEIITLNVKKASYKSYDNSNSRASIKCSEELDAATWRFFQEKVDVDAFFQLPERIGCPGCLDEGAEWIELELADGSKHKVNYSIVEEPDLLQDYIIRLREMLDDFEKCD